MTTATKYQSSLRQVSGNWIVGKVGPYTVSAKAFTEPSEYGMPEDARISKLHVRLGSTELYPYERDMENGPSVNKMADSSFAAVVAAVGKAIR